jgi:hypothetical protein
MVALVSWCRQVGSPARMHQLANSITLAPPQRIFCATRDRYSPSFERVKMEFNVRNSAQVFQFTAYLVFCHSLATGAGKTAGKPEPVDVDEPMLKPSKSPSKSLKLNHLSPPPTLLAHTFQPGICKEESKVRSIFRRKEIKLSLMQDAK